MFDIVVAPLDEIRADTAKALREGRSPMSVSFLRQIRTDNFVHVFDKFTISLYGAALK